MRRCLAALGLIALAGHAHAGAQKEEQLADSVRSALHASIADSAPPEPLFTRFEDRLDYLVWLGEMGNRLARKSPDFTFRQELLRSVWYESKRAGLEPSLVLGLMEVESGFRKHAISSVGARGYMQVMPFWSRQIGSGDPRELFDMRVNLRYGCTILRHYLDREGGDLFLALGRYNGSRGRSEYPDAVMGAARRWVFKPSPARTQSVDGATPPALPGSAATRRAG
ncbi:MULTISPECIES: lytic transglycosylase domain-containing protein [Derxia]|uniref:Lytic transglycosylase domain-containing protein n=1 Tax=Derxia gummosa DSM 723 TaxID=1121388 RepID=A0A8B6XC55_9BURK|nr:MULTISPECIES: lytic transglycosylase domain-containing protein [Derxia]